MLLTIYNLPNDTRYIDVKSLIESKCGIKEIILDNLISWGRYMKVTVGLASEEDAAILMRKINGLFINGTELHVEDFRQKKAAANVPINTFGRASQDHTSIRRDVSMQNIEQPYYNTNRNMGYQNQQTESTAYMGQPSQPRFQANNNTGANPMLAVQQPNFMPYMQSGPAAQNVYTPYTGQPAVQYPTPQRNYQAPNQPQQEPLGFRSEGNSTPWSYNQGRNNEPPKSSFPQREIRWSPERGQRNERSSRWGDDSSDRDARRKSPPRDRRPYERDSQPGTSRQAVNRDKFRIDNRPQRSDNPFVKDNRYPKAPAFDNREVERQSFSNTNKPKPAKKKNQRRPDPNPQQPWAKSNPGSFNAQKWGEQTDKPGSKRKFEQNTEEKPKRVRLPTLNEFKKPIKKLKPKFTAEEYAKMAELRSETWRAQTASQIAKDMIDGKTIADVDHAVFFKELKRVLRERMVGLCHRLERHDGLYAKYRKIYKEEDDEKFMKEIAEMAKAIEAKRLECGWKGSTKDAVEAQVDASGAVKFEKIEVKAAHAPASDVKVLSESKPLISGGTFKLPRVPKLKPEACDKPTYSKSEMFKFKLQKQQNKRIFQHENIILQNLEPKIAKALETEADLLLQKFLEECHDPGAEKVLIKQLTTTVAEDFKRVIKVHVARRMLNADAPIVRVFCSPKMLTRSVLSEFLEGLGITAIKKLSKHPMLLASCKSYEVHDRLCTSEPFQIKDRTISFRPLQIAGPPIKVTKERIDHQRKMFINSQIDDGNTIDDDDDIKLMNDIQELQQQLEHDGPETKCEVDESSASDSTYKTEDNIKEEKQSPNNTIDNIQIEDFTVDVDVNMEDYKIVEDTIGNFNNNDSIEGYLHDGENLVDEDEEENGVNIDNSEEQDGENVDDVEGNGGNLDDNGENVDGNGGNVDDNGGNMDEEVGDDEDGEEQVPDENAVGDDDEDLDIADVDEDDLEDY